jgi:hypothetical protein
MIRFGSSRREQRSTLPVRPSRAKTAKLMSCLERQHRHQVTGGRVMFSIITENGKMVFNTSYHFEMKPKH